MANPKRNKVWAAALREKFKQAAIEKQQVRFITENVCLQFGCGKRLTAIESLYSNKCFKCNQNAKTS